MPNLTTVQHTTDTVFEASRWLADCYLPRTKARFDAALVRYDAWFIVFVAVLLALGATLLAGMAVWCVVNQQGRFTGSWKWVNGIQVSMECRR